MNRRSTAIRRAAAALLIFLAVLFALTLSLAAVPTLADGQPRDGVQFRPRLDKVQDPELPPPTSHQSVAPDAGTTGNGATSSVPWTPLIILFGGLVSAALGSLLLNELRAISGQVSVAGWSGGSFWPTTRSRRSSTLGQALRDHGVTSLKDLPSEPLLIWGAQEPGSGSITAPCVEVPPWLTGTGMPETIGSGACGEDVKVPKAGPPIEAGKGTGGWDPENEQPHEDLHDRPIQFDPGDDVKGGDDPDENSIDAGVVYGPWLPGVTGDPPMDNPLGNLGRTSMFSSGGAPLMQEPGRPERDGGDNGRPSSTDPAAEALVEGLQAGETAAEQAEERAAEADEADRERAAQEAVALERAAQPAQERAAEADEADRERAAQEAVALERAAQQAQEHAAEVDEAHREQAAQGGPANRSAEDHSIRVENPAPDENDAKAQALAELIQGFLNGAFALDANGTNEEEARQASIDALIRGFDYYWKRPLRYGKDFYDTTARNKAFMPGYTVQDGPIDDDLYMVQIHASDKQLGNGRSARFWVSLEDAMSTKSEEEYRDAVALLQCWGPRDEVTVARIPRGEYVTYLEGLAEEQYDATSNEVRKGNGHQYQFRDFDPKWIIGTRKLEEPWNGEELRKAVADILSQGQVTSDTGNT